MRRYGIAAALLLAMLLFVGNFHVFTGSSGISIVPRVTFSVSEFVVNEDALLQMPPLVVATKYPLAAMAWRAHAARDIDAARKISNQ